MGSFYRDIPLGRRPTISGEDRGVLNSNRARKGPSFKGRLTGGTRGLLSCRKSQRKNQKGGMTPLYQRIRSVVRRTLNRSKSAIEGTSSGIVGITGDFRANLQRYGVRRLMGRGLTSARDEPSEERREKMEGKGGHVAMELNGVTSREPTEKEGAP